MADNPQAPSDAHATTDGGSLETEERTIASDAWPNAAETSELPNGASLGRYTILRRLGAGAMGVVYSAYDPDLDRKVAIKILHPRTRAVGGAEEGKLRLVREAKALARLSHPNVVAIHDVGTIGERVFIAMEFVDGQTLGAWLKAGPRSWREVLEVLRLAGEGLAAAHRAGLIHRDFKPDNVVIARDGRVRVLDFGLARASSEGDNDDVPAEVIDQSSSLEVGITSTGVLVGTPAYMSPEQHIGRPADARSDQFAFCVTLFQALYGERPFMGENLPALQANVIQGRIRPVPAGARVPAWLHRVVLRGLSVDPEARFESLEALVIALRRDSSSVRLRWLALVGALALITGIVVGVFGAQTESPCQGVGEELAEVWGEGPKATIGAAFAATGVPYAATAWQSVAKALDEFAGEWGEARREVCQATYVRHEHSEDLFDRRMLCLDRARANFTALVGVYAKPDPTIVEKAVEALDGLDDLAACADLEALMETVPLPSDPGILSKVRGVRTRLAEAKALEVTGKWELAGGIAKEALAEAEAVGYLPLQADALLVSAGLKQRKGDHEPAMAALRKAAEVAASAHYDEAVALAWIDSIYIAGIDQASYERALAAGDAAEVAILRVPGQGSEGGATRLLRARLETNLAATYQRMGRSTDAIELASSALETFEAALGEQHPLVHRNLSCIGLAALDLRDFDRAKASFDRALAIASQVSGPDHPSVAAVLTNLARVAEVRGDRTEALRLAKEAVRIRERVLAPDHAELGLSVAELATIEASLGLIEDAARDFRRARAIYERDPEANAPHLGSLLNNTALMYLEGGNLAEAEVHFRAAIEIFTKTYGRGNRYVAIAQMNLGEVLVQSGSVDAGLEQLATAISALRKSPEAVEFLGYALMFAGETLIDAGDPAAAQERLREALKVYGGIDKPAADEVATAHFALARSMIALRQDRAAARGHAESALLLLPRPPPPPSGEEASPDPNAELRRTIETWLADERRRR